jgi:acyl-CoA thioesterase FadM
MNLVFRLIINWIASHWRPLIMPGQTLALSRRVGLLDLDINFHMNHVRFMRVVEEAAFDGMQRSGFLATMLSQKTVPMIGGAMINYRRELSLWEKYVGRFSYLGADPRWHVFSFHFVNAQGHVVAWGFVKGAAIRWRRSGGAESRILSSDALWAAHAKRVTGLTPMPQLPASVTAWLAVERDAHPAREGAEGGPQGGR